MHMLRLIMLALLAVATLFAGCGSEQGTPKAAQRSICLYSELDNKFTADLV